MPGIIRQCEQYGLEEPRDIYASVPEAEVANLLRPGLRIHTGTLNQREADVSRETSAHYAELGMPDTDPNHGSAAWEDFSKSPGTSPTTHIQDPTLPALPGQGMSF